MIKGFAGRLLCCLGAAMLVLSSRADAPAKFEEVFGLVRSNLTGVNEADLNKAAALGFIEKLGGKVQLDEPASTAATSPALGKTNVFENAFAYMRVQRIAPGLGQQIIDAANSSKKIKGVVLDLRFANGDDYEAAVETANAFIDGEETLLKWGDHVGKTVAKPEALKLPLAVLINRQTSGAAEALAAALWNQKAALLVGNRTAGQAMAFQDFALSTGQHLKIARSKIELPDGTPLGASGVTPDLVVEADEKNERRWLEDPYLPIYRPGTPIGSAPFLTSVTNRLGRRLNGAEVGRRHREELEQEEHPDTPRTAEPSRPGLVAVEERVVQDAALARALDFLKGVTATRLRDASAK